MKKLLSVFLIFALLAIFVGCSSQTGTTGSPSGEHSVSPSGSKPAPSATPAPAQTDSEMFTDRDNRDAYEENSAIVITLNGSTATASSNSVQISGSTVTITEEATYMISGTLDDGMLIVNAPDSAKLQLVFRGAHITSSTCAALYILEADKVFLTLAEGTENSLANGGSFEAIDENNIDAALFSKQDLTINGAGQLTVTSPAGHGIVCKDDLVITGGNLQVEAASHALDANDSVRFADAVLRVTAGKDGIHCENSDDASLGFVYISGGSLNIQAEGDGISTGSYLLITGGSFEILAGGGYENGASHSSGGWGGMGGGYPGMPGSGSSGSASSGAGSTSMKGLKSADWIQIDAGSFMIDSADDSLHSNTSITVNGGVFDIASGDDALHAEDTLTIAACTMDISTCYEGLEGAYIYVQGGDLTMTCSDDGLNAAGGVDSSGSGGRDELYGGWGGMGGSDYGCIEISGGSLTIYAGGDGLDSNGDLTISGGYTLVYNPQSGDTSVLDSENSPSITGGTYIGLGISTFMAETFSSQSSTQGVIACTTGTQAAGQDITIQDADGNVILATRTEHTTVLMIVSCPEMVKGETYTITIGTTTGTLEAS